MSGSFEIYFERVELPDGLLAAVLVDEAGAIITVAPLVPDDEVEALVARLGEQVGVDLLSLLYH